MRVCLIPAAGAARRMRGADKLLEEVDGRPLLLHLAEQARLGGADRVLVTLPDDPAHPRYTALKGAPVTCLPVPGAAQAGMSASLRAGAAACPDETCGLMILPGDMPELRGADMAALWQIFEQESALIVQATTADGVPGHPVVFHPRLLSDFAQLTGDRGAAPLLKAHAADVRAFALPGQRARCDLDTPEDWARWRSMRRI